MGMQVAACGLSTPVVCASGLQDVYVNHVSHCKVEGLDASLGRSMECSEARGSVTAVLSNCAQLICCHAARQQQSCDVQLLLLRTQWEFDAKNGLCNRHVVGNK